MRLQIGVLFAQLQDSGAREAVDHRSIYINLWSLKTAPTF